MADYADNSDVSGRMPGLYPTGFTPDTQPTDDMVSRWLQEAEDELNGTLIAVGLPAPFTDVKAKRILGRYIVDYTQGQVLFLLAKASGNTANNDGLELIRSFERRLMDIRANFQFYTDMLSASDSGTAVGVSSHVTSHPDGLEAEGKVSWIKRDTKF